MENLEFSLVRKYFFETYTIGKLSADQEYVCDTLEDKVRDLHDRNHDGDFDDPGEGKIYGETAISYGRYQIIMTYSPKFKRRMPELLRVEGFTNIRIHRTVTAKGIEGCIGVGLNKKKGQLIDGPYFEDLICRMIDAAIDEGKKVFITIK